MRNKQFTERASCCCCLNCGFKWILPNMDGPQFVGCGLHRKSDQSTE